MDAIVHVISAIPQRSVFNSGYFKVRNVKITLRYLKLELKEYKDEEEEQIL